MIKNTQIAIKTRNIMLLYLFFQSIENKKLATYGRESVLKTVAAKSGRFICQACNSLSCAYEYVPFFVTDIPNNGFSGKLGCLTSYLNFFSKIATELKQKLEMARL